MLAAGVLIRFFDTVLRAYCIFDTVEASVMIATHVRDRKLVLTSAMSCLQTETHQKWSEARQS